MQLDTLREDYVATNPAIRSPETKRLLRISTSRFAEFMGRPCVAADLTDRNLTAYMQHRRGMGIRESTLERETAKLLTLARYAALSGLIPPPRMRLRKAPADAPVALLRHEVRALWRAAASYEALIGGVPGSVYMPALLDVLWDTGERLGAVYVLTRGDIDLAGRWVTLRSRKGGGAVQVRRVRRATARSLGKLLEASAAPQPFAVFGHQSALYHHLNRLLVTAGISVDRRHKFHCLRRSHASWLYRAGGDATASLGHADQATTRRHYFDVRITGGRQPSELLFSPLGFWGRLRAACGF
jgi:integrase